MSVYTFVRSVKFCTSPTEGFELNARMQDQLHNLHVDDLPYLERDLNFAQKVSLSFLLFGDQHALATYILQRLLALVRAPETEQMHSDLLRQYALTNPDHWRGYIVEALCIINARSALRKLGFRWQELRLHYLPHVHELSVHVHPLLKAMYIICEQLTVAQSGRLVLDVNEKLARRQASSNQPIEPLRLYDFAYLEIVMLDWLTRRHLKLGDIDAIGSDMQLLIEYFKLKELPAMATLLIQTINTCASELPNPATSHRPNPVNKCPTDAAADGENEQPIPDPPPAEAAVGTAPLPSNHHRRSNALQVRQENAGILLIINQQRFHRNVSADLSHLLPPGNLASREGTDVDKQKLGEVFSALGYTVESHNNVDHLELLRHIRSVCERSTLRDSLIVCILSHGFEGAVYGADSIPLSIIDIQNVLCAEESLYDKPKLLIIQACQQNESQKQTRDVNATTQSPIQHANMVVAMSTVPRFVALRHSLEGSWFIQTLCDAVQRHAASEHVLDILTIVNRQVSQKRGGKNEKMVPVVLNTLSQNVFFPAI